MKKTVSILISAVIAFLPFVTVFAAPLQETRESKELNSFINGITELVREYDADKEFTVPENDETAQIQTFSAGNSTDNAEPKYNLQDFQTARLIVRVNGKFNKHGALEDVSGFEDFHILQYESPEKAMAAYNQFQLEKSIISIAPDLIVSAKQGTEPSQEENMQMTENLCEWSVQRTVDGYAQAIIDAVNALELKSVEPPVTEEPTKPDATKPGVPEETTKPSVPEEPTTLPDSQKTDIPNTSGVVPVSYTVALLTLLSPCIYITSRKRRS